MYFNENIRQSRKVRAKMAILLHIFLVRSGSPQLMLICAWRNEGRKLRSGEDGGRELRFEAAFCTALKYSSAFTRPLFMFLWPSTNAIMPFSSPRYIMYLNSLTAAFLKPSRDTYYKTEDLIESRKLFFIFSLLICFFFLN